MFAGTVVEGATGFSVDTWRTDPSAAGERTSAPAVVDDTELTDPVRPSMRSTNEPPLVLATCGDAYVGEPRPVEYSAGE